MRLRGISAFQGRETRQYLRTVEADPPAIDTGVMQLHTRFGSWQTGLSI